MSLYLTTFIIIINGMFNKTVLETSGFAFQQDSLKAEEKALKTQLSCFKEEFQLLVRSAAELYPEILDDEFPQKVAARQQLQLSPNKSPSSPEADTTILFYLEHPQTSFVDLFSIKTNTEESSNF